MENKHIRVLIIEDRPSDVDLMVYELKTFGYEIEFHHVDNAQDYISSLSEPWDVILSDYTLPQFNAMDALQILQKKNLTTPFIVVTGSISEEVAVECMKQGAIDYLLKDRLARLGPAVTKALNEYALMLEKQTAEIALENSEKLYRSVFENTGSAMVIVDEDSTIVLVNNQFANISGYPKTELEGKKKWFEFVHPEDKSMMLVYHQLRREESGDAPNIYTFRFINRNQEQMNILLNVNLIEGSRQTIASLINITKRVELQKELRNTEMRYQSIFEGVQDAIFVEDQHNQILDVNQRACELFGYTREEFFELSVEDIVPEGNFVVTVEKLRKGPLDNVESVNRKKNGQLFPVELSSQLQVIGDAEVIVTVLRDISERKRIDRALKRQVKELTALHAIAQAGTQEINEDLIIAKATAVIKETLNPESYGVLLIYPRENVLKTHSSYQGIPDQVMNRNLPLGEGVTGQVAQTGEPQLHNDVTRVPNYVEDLPGAMSELCVPIKTKHSILGVVNIETHQANAYDEHDLQLLLTLGRQLATSIERARLFNSIELQVKRLQSLHTIDQAISSSLDLKVTLGIIMEQITNQLEIDAADILLFNPYTQTLTYHTGQGFHNRQRENTILRLGSGYAGRVALSNQQITIQDLSSQEEIVLDENFINEEGFIFYHALPLTSKGQTKGVLELFNRSRKDFDPGWKQYLQALVSQMAIAIENAEMFENLQKANLDLSLAYDTTLEGWARALELRHHETRGHSQRVTDLALNLARGLGIRGEDLTHIRRGALLHDIGKIAVPDHILLKSEPLTNEELRIIREHPRFAKLMLEPIKHLEKAMEIPLYHHERWNGSGYPEGLKEDIIPLSARIFAVVDVWDALTSDRPYRKAWSKRKARKYLKDNAGVLFDPRVMETFLEQMKEK